ncbi:membrane protein [Methylopila jiangsuensis]|uniref:Membrane protein n=1 Tax=Methylopila jiangsuensis TaxID=586230 RepID=A0A9W6JJ53_9HYPH|nr:heme biosynthesis HemY N-terminal domain-containing protein [Methylopila jiangsuensis]MDR6286863.1 HemY protein [Methylopila jiangsuensis]GLK76790.1 membrane protein [Methylopila jiangsuensis]
MIRVLLYLALVGVFALGAIWIVDRPGELTLTWQGYRVETSVAVAAAAVALVAALTVVLWNVTRWILAGPEAFALFRRNRRRSKGYQAIARGVVAVGTGDARLASKEANDARRLLGKEPLTLVLAAQAAQLSGDRMGAEAAFRAMTESPATRALGLRGLFVEAERRGDQHAAKALAEEAARQSPQAPWAAQALFDFQCAERDWTGALTTLERLTANKLIEKPDAKRRRAVLLTAQAMDGAGADPALALRRAKEAHGLAPDFVPAAAIAGRLLAEQGEARKATKIVEATWLKAPHPDLAEVYVHARPSEPARDKLKRAKALSERSGDHPEGLIAVARAAMAAREFGAARAALDKLLSTRPTARVCLLMAELEDLEHGATGASREWLSRALRAPRDPLWVADGVASDVWEPVSPISGRLDAFVWKTPVEDTRPRIAAEDWLQQAPAELTVTAPSAPVAVLPRKMPELQDGAPAPEPAKPAATAPAKVDVITPAKPSAPVVEKKVSEVAVEPAPEPAKLEPVKPGSPARAPQKPTAAVFPLSRAPDDPGPSGAEATDTVMTRSLPATRPNY